MSVWFGLLVILAAINPPRLRPYLDTRSRPRDALVAAAVVLGICALLVVSATTILDALEITDETWHIAAGAVGVLIGARVLIAPAISNIELPSGSAALVPYAFPLLFTPPLAVLSILFGSTESTVASLGWIGSALVLALAVCALPYLRRAVWSAAARFAGTTLIVLSVALVIAGIRDV